MNAKHILIFIAGIAGGIAGLSAWSIIGEHSEHAEKSRTAETSVQPVAEAKEAGVTLGESAVRTGGIVAGALQTVSHRQETEALAVVLTITELNDLQNNHAAAATQADAALAALNLSRKEYDRLKTLYADDHNVSEKAVQLAEATWHSDAARVSASQAALRTIEQNARQQWGAILAESVMTDSALFQRLAAQQDVLIQLTLPLANRISPIPQTIRLQLPDGNFAQASLISPSPRVDLRFQGRSYFYSAPVQKAGLAPGMNIPAYLPTGPQEQGIFIPSTAVVWWQDKAWIYVQEDKGRYVRTEISTTSAMNDGWFATNDELTDKPVVVTGAQLLLSAEFRPQGGGGEEGDD
ncbi:hypothetical protein GALL_199090 [mine drainage metagenome]|uniref:Uncharacterized protein n=1 Tax=mine drainage metagenome TaxID=410659 RepID=A0A1J5RR18_9ZZZZ